MANRINRMQTIMLGGKRSKIECLKIEAPGCIVTVHIGLTNNEGQSVTRISIDADGDRYSGERAWYVATKDFENLNPDNLSTGFGVRIVQEAA